MVTGVGETGIARDSASRRSICWMCSGVPRSATSTDRPAVAGAKCGINVGVLSAEQCQVFDIRSHVDDSPFDIHIFSCDCAEYRFTFLENSVLAGQPLLVPVNV